MQNSVLIIVLAVGTLLIVCGVTLFQKHRVGKSQAKRGETPGGIAGPDPD